MITCVRNAGKALFWAAIAALWASACGAVEIRVESAPVEPAPADLRLDDLGGVATVADIVRHIPELLTPLGGRYPVFIWGTPAANGRRMEQRESLLQDRGLCVPPNIGYRQDEEFDGIADVIRFREQRGWVSAVICQGWGQVSFSSKRAPAHQPPALQDREKYPCPGVYKALLQKARERAVRPLDLLKQRNAAPDVFLMDWEVWNRHKHQPDPARLADVLQQAQLCPACQANLPPQYLESPEAFLRGLELIRSEIIREAFVKPVKERFPNARIGNYYSVSHVRSDQPLQQCRRALGWHGSGLDFSQPVAYGRFWRYHNRREFVGWNVFRLYLQELTAAAQHQVGTQFQLPWIARDLSYHPSEPFVEAGGRRYAWPRESYREYLRHAMLRGAKSFCIFKPNRAGPGNRLMYLTELEDSLGVFREMRRFGEILDAGEPLNLADLPGEAYSTDDAVVWSGVATRTKAIVRAVSFTGREETVEVEVLGARVSLQAPPEGRTYLLTATG